MKYKIWLTSLIWLFIAMPVLAQTDTDPQGVAGAGPDERTTAVDVAGAGPDEKVIAEILGVEQSEVAATADVELALDGVVVEAPKQMPTGFGLWWRGLRERIVLATTFDPVKKAEKALTFAEERQEIAKKILETSDDVAAQARAQKVLDRSSALMQTITVKKDELMAHPGERVNRLFKNVATHELRREASLDKMEDRITQKVAEHPELAGRLENFQALREQSSERGQGLLKAIENAPEAVQEHLTQVKERIDAKAAEQKAFVEANKELLQKAKSGDDAARVELKQAFEERKTEMVDTAKAEMEQRVEEIRAKVAEKEDALKKDAENGDASAAEKLKAIDQLRARVEKQIEVTPQRLEQRVENRIEKKEIRTDQRIDKAQESRENKPDRPQRVMPRPAAPQIAPAAESGSAPKVIGVPAQ